VDTDLPCIPPCGKTRDVCDRCAVHSTLLPRGHDEGTSCGQVDKLLGQSEAISQGSCPGGEIDPGRRMQGGGGRTIQRCPARWIVPSPQLGWVKGYRGCMTLEVGHGLQETTLTRERATSWQRGKSNGWCKSAALGSSQLMMGARSSSIDRGSKARHLRRCTRAFESRSMSKRGRKAPAPSMCISPRRLN
jgi:hypothetical protein